jgi:hypothetical protein
VLRTFDEGIRRSSALIHRVIECHGFITGCPVKFKFKDADTNHTTEYSTAMQLSSRPQGESRDLHKHKVQLFPSALAPTSADLMQIVWKQ